jgi:hypothetical protein
MTSQPVPLGVWAFQGRGLSGRGWTVVGRLGEGGPEALPSLGDGGGPSPGGVDA